MLLCRTPTSPTDPPTTPTPPRCVPLPGKDSQEAGGRRGRRLERSPVGTSTTFKAEVPKPLTFAARTRSARHRPRPAAAVVQQAAGAGAEDNSVGAWAALSMAPSRMQVGAAEPPVQAGLPA